ncbi:MAG: hypothetical protein ACI846_001115 [Pseudoalteromonas distincta]|jgi:hypothetical protein|uniref:hypothetical protein n=1 Tax=Pseudoalteromonas distincta TaxID=77608 RepID=UPI0039E50875
MDSITDIEIMLESMKAMSLNEALSSLKNFLENELKWEWETIDKVLVMYRDDPSKLCASFLAGLSSIAPKIHQDDGLIVT